MLINYLPGDECRVAVASDGKLEDLHIERASVASHVGNIYVGKVTNVEASIQAAFIHFGLEQNGFLHISDLHPQYFPGEDDDTTEDVGKKTPRHDRPPIQRALKRGQEILVQVIKEGIGTKGPTLTSYLSIPGRYLVMMPAMDRVGVSRKIEDDELRRKMRETLDQLDLPDGFGFILRTAGMDRAKTDLKRDLAYLNRLWQDMERRRKAGSGPRLLYAESDLLLRALRDIITPDVDEIVIDDVSALRRAARFLKIFAPRSAPSLRRYDSDAPIFHAYGIEEQIQSMHSRRVDLPSGGYLFIDETEALVAIDVNSGKMRSHGDAETTAYKTNQEAVDEICRQMKLRDLGGLVVLDLIDMRSRAHQRDIEQQLRANLKNDAARSKALPISQFGMIELTRQRMHGSMRSSHFAACPECEGRGQVQRPDSVAGAAMRDLAAQLSLERIRKIELVVSPRVASELLSFKRPAMTSLERRTGKTISVRVSETIPVDRVTYYAYDERGADVDVTHLPKMKLASESKIWVDPGAAESDSIVDPIEEERLAMIEGESASDSDIEAVVKLEPHPIELIEFADGSEDIGAAEKRKRRRRRRRRRGAGDDAQIGDGEPGDRDEAPTPAQDEMAPDAPTAQHGGATRATDEAVSVPGEGGKKRRRRRRRKVRSPVDETQVNLEDSSSDEITDSSQPSETPVAPSEPTAAPETGSRTRAEPADRNGRAPRPTLAAASQRPPRGDSWDLDPVVVRPISRRPAAYASAATDSPAPDRVAATEHDRASPASHEDSDASAAPLAGEQTTIAEPDETAPSLAENAEPARAEVESKPSRARKAAPKKKTSARKKKAGRAKPAKAAAPRKATKASASTKKSARKSSSAKNPPATTDKE